MQAIAMAGVHGGAVHLMVPEAPLSMAGDDVMTGALTAFEEVWLQLLVWGAWKGSSLYCELEVPTCKTDRYHRRQH